MTYMCFFNIILLLKTPPKHLQIPSKNIPKIAQHILPNTLLRGAHGGVYQQEVKANVPTILR